MHYFGKARRIDKCSICWQLEQYFALADESNISFAQYLYLFNIFQIVEI